jgi:hypothetical protein
MARPIASKRGRFSGPSACLQAAGDAKLHFFDPHQTPGAMAGLMGKPLLSASWSFFPHAS